MNRAIFSEWLLKLQEKCKREGRKILLLTDNFKCHQVDLQLGNVDILFLPANCTSKSQALDQGIIKNAKLIYKQKLVQLYWSQVQMSNKAFERIDLLQGIRLFKEAWDQVKSETIRNCFDHALPEIHPKPDQPSQPTEPDVPPIDPKIVASIFPQGQCFADYVHLDDNLITSDENGIFDENDISEQSINSDGESQSEVQVEPADETQQITDKEALESLLKLIKHCNHGNNGTPEINSVLHKYLEKVTESYVNNKVQKDIRSYFTKM
jgi:hypothetical protein